jgi:hypothetical protein
MPKIELRKIQQLDGDIFYYVYVDDKYIEGTCTLNNEELAIEKYEMIKNGAGEITTVIKSEEI